MSRINGPKVVLGVAFTVASAVLLMACGDKQKASTQVAAKVNSEEISVHQINFLLQRTPRVTTETADAAGRQILERLIGQELAVQKAQELKLDRNPDTVQAMEAARREVLARAYLDTLADGVVKPTPEEVSDFYTKKPALFKERKVYTFQEINFTGTPPQLAEAESRLSSITSVQDAAAYLKGSGLKYRANVVTQPAENLPLPLLDRFAALGVGHALVLPSTEGAGKAFFLAAANEEPVDLVTAGPAIEKFLLNDRRRLKTEADMKALRAGAKVELMGKFAQAAASAPPVAQTPLSTAAPAASASPDAAAPRDPPASGLSSDALRRGLTGIK